MWKYWLICAFLSFLGGPHVHFAHCYLAPYAGSLEDLLNEGCACRWNGFQANKSSLASSTLPVVLYLSCMMMTNVLRILRSASSMICGYCLSFFKTRLTSGKTSNACHAVLLPLTRKLDASQPVKAWQNMPLDFSWFCLSFSVDPSDIKKKRSVRSYFDEYVYIFETTSWYFWRQWIYKRGTINDNSITFWLFVRRRK